MPSASGWSVSRLVLRITVSYECDTLLLSCGLIPENELSRSAGVELNPVTNGPTVNESLETSIPASGWSVSRLVLRITVSISPGASTGRLRLKMQASPAYTATFLFWYTLPTRKRRVTVSPAASGRMATGTV